MREPNWKCLWCQKPYYRHPCFFRREQKACCSRRCGELQKGRTPIQERFWKYVTKTETCWIWTGCKSPKGYGRIADYDGVRSQMRLAHCLSFEIHRGPIHSGLHVCHSCDNPPCVNPDHLFLGTNRDNIDDKMAKGRQAKGSKVWNSKINDDIVREIRRRRAEGERPGRLAEEFGISGPTVSDLLHGRTWQHVE